MEAFISKIEKNYHIYLIIIIAVVIYTSIIALPHNAVGKTLHDLEIESKSIVENVPGINVGKNPISIALDDYHNIAYVANQDSNTVSIINGETLEVSKISVGKSPSSIAVDENSNIAYVANQDSNTVSIINETDGVYRNIANVTVGKSPSEIDVNENSNIAYVLNYLSNTVSIINETDDGVYRNIANVTVGKSPSDIAVDKNSNIAYVANAGPNTVSIINETDDGVYRNIANVTVGKSPLDIDVDKNRNIAYVANAGPNTVSIIKETDDGVYRNIANVTVGESPSEIDVNENNNIAYVLNYLSNTVSMINETDDGVYRNIANVTVGESPSDIAVDENSNIAYVTNAGPNTVSIIEGFDQKVQAGVSFDINPFHAGHIVCNNIIIPTNQYFYVDSRTQCLAQPNKGFQFNSWIENLESNSSRTINASIPTDSLVDWIKSALGFGSKQTSGILTVTKFGSFTANFETLPPAIPSEYFIPLYGVIVSSIVGWSIPSIVGWVKTKKMIRTTNTYHKRISSFYEDNKLDYNDIAPLNKIKTDMSDAYAKGKISDAHYQNLKNEISVLYEEILKKRIDSFNGRNNTDDGGLLDQIKYDIENTYAKGKISDEHYRNLKNEISVLYEEILRKRIDSFNGRNNTDDGGLLDQIKYDIEDTYAKGKISDEHYKLLNKKIESFVKTSDNIAEQ
jgi:YVTN family beta-propeller protein